MNKDTIVGKAKQIEGKLRDAKGDLTDNPNDDVAGKAKVVEGKIQEGYGKAKAAVKQELDEA
jgi:uncharacterized protein YjbJ (UPF0337 family)